MTLKIQVILILVVCLIGSFSVVQIVSMKQKVAIVNVSEAVNDFSRALALNKHLSSVKKEQFANQFSSALKYFIQEYARLHHLTIINQQSVLAGGSDITRQIEGLVQKRLAQMGKTHVSE